MSLYSCCCMHTTFLQLTIYQQQRLKSICISKLQMFGRVGPQDSTHKNTDHTEAYRNNPDVNNKNRSGKTDTNLHYTRDSQILYTIHTGEWIGSLHVCRGSLTWPLLGYLVVVKKNWNFLSSDSTVTDSSIITYGITNTSTSIESRRLVSYPTVRLNVRLLLFVRSLLLFAFLLALLMYLLLLVYDRHDSAQLVRSQLHVLFTEQTNHLRTRTCARSVGHIAR